MQGVPLPGPVHRGGTRTEAGTGGLWVMPSIPFTELALSHAQGRVLRAWRVEERVNTLPLRLDVLPSWEVSMFPKEYKYIIGIGLMLFGLFALNFPEYQHPIYGYINLGKYRIFIGVASVISGAFYIYHIRNINNK